MDMQPGQFQIPRDSDQSQNQLPQPIVSPNPQPSRAVQPQTPGAVIQSTAAQQSEQPYGNAQAPIAATVEDQSQQPASLPVEDSNWDYNQAVDAGEIEPLPDNVTWTAAEFVEHPKSTNWYILLFVAAAILSSIDFVVTKDWFSTVIIVVAAVLFGIYAGHKPRNRSYILSPDGIHIGDKTYGYHVFKSFSIAEEGSTANIMFMPLARFAPPLTIYVTGDMEDKVLDYLSLFLPIEQRRADAVDGLLRRIRF